MKSLLLLLLVFAGCSLHTDAAVACSSSQLCEELLYTGSECSPEGFCTNPYTKGGCLANRVPGWKKKRVCSSDDPPNAAELGYCHESYSGLEYTEIRLAAQDWESAFFVSWIQQIILSELLNVPTSLETGEPGLKISFYDENNTLDYGVSYPWEGLETALQVKDCRKVVNEKGTHYTPCVHVISEVWHNNYRNKIDDMEKRGVIEPFDFIGIFGQHGWHIPRFTAARDPTLLTYLGLTGEENRRKLAETFLTPTTWLDYCNEVSPDNCTTPSNSTARAPIDKETEGVMYFSEGLYKGHFRKTAQNDCDLNPSSCTGHFTDWPCGWSSAFQPQAFHNNIALNTTGDQPFGNGYSYPRLIEIWLAANATKSDVIIMWWQPDALFQQFVGTDAEFHRIDLPPATLKCLQARKDPIELRCSGDFAAYQGSPESACDDPDQSLQKLISTALFEVTYDPNIPEATRSPGYDAVSAFNLDSLQLDEIFKLWLNRNTDKYGFDPRDAVCQWVVDNLEHIQSFVPRSYPRVILEDDQFDPLRYTALAVGIVAVVLVFTTCIATYAKRSNAQVRYAQLDFLFVLLAGLLLVSVASVISAVSNSDGECVSVTWLFNVGYTLVLVSMCVKVFAINRLLRAAKKFQRVELKRASLFGAVFLLSGVTIVFMILWTTIDPPQVASQYLLTDEVNDAGETIVSVSYYCRSNSDAWMYISLGVQGLLLLVLSILAIQMNNTRHELNESQSLAIMIYSDFIFWVLRLVAFAWLEKSVFASAVPGIVSLILGCDSIASICIYFLPKIWFASYCGRSTSTPIERSMSTFERDLSLRRFENSGRSLDIDMSAYERDLSLRQLQMSKHKALSEVTQVTEGKNSESLDMNCPHCGKEIDREMLSAEPESARSQVAPSNDESVESKGAECPKCS